MGVVQLGVVQLGVVQLGIVQMGVDRRKCMPLCYVWVSAPAIYLCPLRINAMQVVGECLRAWGVGSPSPRLS